MDGSIAVIVPTRNSSRTLERLIRSVLRQLDENDEFLIVDGESNDGTVKIAQELGVRVLSYPSPRDMRGYARNLGASNTTSNALVFLDSDMEVEQGALNEARSLLCKGFEGVTFPEITLGRGLLGAVRSWERNQTERLDELTFSRCLTRMVFDKAGGFDERIVGFEDLDLQATLIELGTRLSKTTLKIAHHEETQVFASYLQKRALYERTVHYYRVKHPTIAKRVFSPVNRLKLYLEGVHRPRDLVRMIVAISLRLAEFL